MGEFDVELGDATGAVGRQGEGDRAPADVHVGMVIHLLCLDGNLSDRLDSRGEVGEGHVAADRVVARRPTGQEAKLMLDLVGIQQSAHDTTVADSSIVVESPQHDAQSHEQVIVVASAIIRDGRVLLARRTQPPSTAGHWEPPGGKVEPGETDSEALRREIMEELGVSIEVGEFIGEHDLPGIGVLRLYLAAIAHDTEQEGGRAEPILLDHHDRLVWADQAAAAQLSMSEPDAALVARLWSRLPVE